MVGSNAYVGASLLLVSRLEPLGGQRIPVASGADGWRGMRCQERGQPCMIVTLSY